jgi:hypothetical protein
MGFVDYVGFGLRFFFFAGAFSFETDSSTVKGRTHADDDDVCFPRRRRERREERGERES